MAEITKNYQQIFNEILQNQVPNNISLAKELSEILNVSLDSAYRRLRNQTDYTLNETMAIALHFELPLETLNSGISNVVTFKINMMNDNQETYHQYLINMLENMKKLHAFESAHIFFAAEDIPVFYHFSLPHLCNFKIAYWLKSLLNVKEYQFLTFEEILIPEEITNTAKAIYQYFEKIETTEIWTSETALSTIKQIKFYWDAGFFEDKASVYLILEDLRKALSNIKNNADVGYKFVNGSMSNIKNHLYVSDVMIGTNCILAKTENFAASYISYSTFNFMQTNNLHFNQQNELWMNNIQSKSSLISGVAEKQRNQFFKSIFLQIDELILYIKNN